MTWARKLSFFLICFSIITLGSVAAADDKPATAPSPGAVKKCVDMDGREFKWAWSNVPFASSCSSELATEAPGRKTDTCRASCRDRFGACSPPKPDKKQFDACFDQLESCQASCVKKQN
ncbi:hypothetical protein [Bradyrhizobium lablabi]|uniref:hypothetical protein n=1 Tax=Bradyrhizobium lablabi TaxID=722472 RepID=UPI001BA76B5E|nr:hypothetical protein [Bradyrhizobium lablabi]MBR0695893.1 hypothetical protein [Bradyrhizobium lablabi]